MMGNIELYEALKLSVGEDAARMIADVVPPSRELATRLDVEQLRADMNAEFGRVHAEFGKVRAEIHASSASMTRHMLLFFLPLWLGMIGVLAQLGLRAL